MTQSEQASLAAKYFVDDLPGARQVGGRLHSIITNFDAQGQATELACDFLKSNGLLSLHALVSGHSDLDSFRQDAAQERAVRIQLAQAAAAEAEAEAARQAAERAAASASIFNDPEFRRRLEAKQLRRRYSVGYIEPHHYRRAMRLLGLLSQGQRLEAADVVWLQTEAEECWTLAVAAAWNELEAQALSAVWRKTGDPWAAVNASSHWRKCDQPSMSLQLTSEALASASAPKVRSALLTTRGGALRDLGRPIEAKAHGEQAHQLTPKDYRPCTLLGAACAELGDLAAGHQWFTKAEELGADRRSIDQEIKALLARASQEERERMRAYLFGQNPKRFAWLRPGKDAAYRGTPSR